MDRGQPKSSYASRAIAIFLVLLAMIAILGHMTPNWPVSAQPNPCSGPTPALTPPTQPPDTSPPNVTAMPACSSVGVGQQDWFSAAATAHAGATITSITFNWGDGTAPFSPPLTPRPPGVQTTATHTFMSPPAGPPPTPCAPTPAALPGFCVTVTATDSGGLTNTTSIPITVMAVDVTLTASPSGPLAVGQTVTFTSTATSFTGQNIAGFTFNFGDGTMSTPDTEFVPAPAPPSNQSTVTVTHIYTAPGPYTVTVTATDASGGTGTASTTVEVGGTSTGAVTVTSVKPTCGPAAGGTSVTMTGTNFTGATAVNFGATAATTFTVNSATSITATSPAGTDGTTVDVTVVTPGGTSAPNPPADQFTYGTTCTPVVTLSAPAVSCPATVNFTSTATAPTGKTITGFSFNFGDGATSSPDTESVPAPPPPSNQTTVTVAHAYTAPGPFTAMVTATDSGGGTGSASTVVCEPPCPVSSTPTAEPAVPFASAGGPYQGFANQPITFNAGGSKPAPGQAIITYSWDFGDSPTHMQTTVSVPTITHTYQAAYSYLVTLLVTSGCIETNTSTGASELITSTSAATTTATVSPTPNCYPNSGAGPFGATNCSSTSTACTLGVVQTACVLPPGCAGIGQAVSPCASAPPCPIGSTTGSCTASCGNAIAVSPILQAGVCPQPAAQTTGGIQVSAGGPYQGKAGIAIVFGATVSGGVASTACTTGANYGLPGLACSTDVEPASGGSYLWDFGDGNTGTGQVLTHTYAQPGSYSVVLTFSLGGSGLYLGQTTAQIVSPATPTPSPAPASNTGLVATPAPSFAAPATPVATPAAALLGSAFSPSGTPTPPIAQVLLSSQGNGASTTSSFTAASGWDLNWSYDCSNAPGGAGEFMVLVNNADGSLSQNQSIDDSGSGSSGVQHYSNGGTFYLDINSGCTWTISAVTST